jgi:hypothetical protein
MVAGWTIWCVIEMPSSSMGHLALLVDRKRLSDEFSLIIHGAKLSEQGSPFKLVE